MAPSSLPRVVGLLLCTVLVFFPMGTTGRVLLQSNSPVDIVSLPAEHASLSNIGISKYASVWGIHIFASPSVADSKVQYIASVLREYLDNDEDGNVDDPVVLSAMLNFGMKGACMAMYANENEAQAFFEGDHDYECQYQGAEETRPNLPIDDDRDATLEEVLHLVTFAGYQQAYPGAFGTFDGFPRNNLIDYAMDEANGNCGYSFPGSFKPWRYPNCVGNWHYDDRTCDYACLTTEYFYWGLVGHLGGLNRRCNDIADEWKLCTSQQIAAQNPLLYDILVDPQWKLPTVLPDGVYAPTPTTTAPTPSPTTTRAPTPSPTTPAPPPLTTQAPSPSESLWCARSEGVIKVEWIVAGERATCTAPDGSDVRQSLRCSGSVQVERVDSPQGLNAVCSAPDSATLRCLESLGDLKVQWTSTGETARCLAEDGTLIAGPFNCEGGEFLVERVVSPAAALDAVCIPQP